MITGKRSTLILLVVATAMVIEFSNAGSIHTITDIIVDSPSALNTQKMRFYFTLDNPLGNGSHIKLTFPSSLPVNFPDDQSASLRALTQTLIEQVDDAGVPQEFCGTGGTITQRAGTPQEVYVTFADCELTTFTNFVLTLYCDPIQTEGTFGPVGMATISTTDPGTAGLITFNENAIFGTIRIGPQPSQLTGITVDR